MDKELLNKILPYCGHGLKVLEDEQIRTVVGIYYDQFDYEQGYSNYRNGNINLSKPILFSPDCLTREIETECGEEVPIIEMAKLSAGDYDWKVDGGYGCDYDLNGVSKLSFEFHHHSCNFSFALKDAFEMEQLPVDHQFELFQYLYSRHIAFNLEPDEYVSVESLEKNPYAK